MKPGDVLLVAFPKVDLRQGKLRPALMLAAMPGRHEDILMAMISSKTHQFIIGFDELIKETDPDFTMTGLKQTSVIRLSRLATIQKRIIPAKLGEIDEARLTAIYDRLCDFLESLKSA